MNRFHLPNFFLAGTALAEDAQDRRGIYLSNVSSFLLCGILAFLLTGRILILQDYNKVFLNSLPSFIVGFMIFICPFFLNKAGWVHLSRLFLCTMPVMYVWYQFVTGAYIAEKMIVSQIDTLRLYLLALSGLPYLVLNISRPWVFVGGILPSFVSLLFFETLASGFG